MRDLTMQEVNEAAGGNPVAIGAAIGVATGIVGNYIYEAVGGKAGIDSMVSGLFSGFGYASGPSYMSGSGAFG